MSRSGSSLQAPNDIVLRSKFRGDHHRWKWELFFGAGSHCSECTGGTGFNINIYVTDCCSIIPTTREPRQGGKIKTNNRKGGDEEASSIFRFLMGFHRQKSQCKLPSHRIAFMRWCAGCGKRSNCPIIRCLCLFLVGLRLLFQTAILCVFAGLIWLFFFSPEIVFFLYWVEDSGGMQLS